MILDEAHKAYGATNREANEDFVRSVNRLDPRMVIELSATPNSGISNLLVDISGVQLQKEDMIKLPVQVSSSTGGDWQNTLSKAHEELEKVAIEASSLRNEEGRYIRPIAVVRVERTGRDQRDGERIHAEDVRDHLTQVLGVPGRRCRCKVGREGRSWTRRLVVRVFRDSMDHHEGSPNGGVGLSVRVCLSHARQHVGTEGTYAISRQGLTPAPCASHRAANCSTNATCFH